MFTPAPLIIGSSRIGQNQDRLSPPQATRLRPDEGTIGSEVSLAPENFPFKIRCFPPNEQEVFATAETTCPSVSSPPPHWILCKSVVTYDVYRYGEYARGCGKGVATALLKAYIDNLVQRHVVKGNQIPPEDSRGDAARRAADIKFPGGTNPHPHLGASSEGGVVRR